MMVVAMEIVSCSPIGIFIVLGMALNQLGVLLCASLVGLHICFHFIYSIFCLMGLTKKKLVLNAMSPTCVFIELRQAWPEGKACGSTVQVTFRIRSVV